MLSLRRALSVLSLCALLLTSALARADEVSDAEKQIGFLNRTMAELLPKLRQKVRDDQREAALRDIHWVTQTLEQLAQSTRIVRQRRPEFVPNPPLDFAAMPATSRAAAFVEVRELAVQAAKQLNEHYAEASRALLEARNRQIATIAISMLKFTVENVQPSAGGKVGDLAIEGVKQLNNRLLDDYLGAPISGGVSEVKLLRDNFVSIQDGVELLERLSRAQREVLDLGGAMRAKQDGLAALVEAEKAWLAFAWMREAQHGRLRLRVEKVTLSDLTVRIDGRVLTPADEGAVLELPNPVRVELGLMDERRKFCLEKRAYAATTKSIELLPKLGGGPEDSLEYRSTRMDSTVSWRIQEEQFDWSLSHTAEIEEDPDPVSPAYWSRRGGRVLLTLLPQIDGQVSLHIKGRVRWRVEKTRNGAALPPEEETHEGKAMVVLDPVK